MPLRGFGEAAERARQANIARQVRIEKMYSEMMGMVGPGGAFEKAGLGEIERARTRGVGGEMQQMISSGMYGTTTAAGVPRQWEAEVGAPARLRLEDIMTQRQLGVKQQMAGFLERIQEPYPDYALMASLMPAAEKTVTRRVGGTQKWGTYGAAATPSIPRRMASFGPTSVL